MSMIILIESVRHIVRLWPRAAMALAIGLTAGSAAHAGLLKNVADDLNAVVSATVTPTKSWVNDINQTRYVNVLIDSNSTDPELTALRSAVLAAGGSVYNRFLSVPALSALLPASKIAQFAARSDVQSISPN